MREIDAATAISWIEEGKARIIDVRQPFEFASAHIPGSTLIPSSQFSAKALPADPGQKTVLVCASGARSAQACRALGAGHSEVYSLRGGLQAWRAAGGTLEGRGGSVLPLLRKLALLGLMILAALAIGRAFSG